MFRNNILFNNSLGAAFFGPPFSVRERSIIFAKNMTRWRTEPNVSINSNLFKAIRRIGRSPRTRHKTYSRNRRTTVKWAYPRRTYSFNYPPYYPPQFYLPFNPQPFIW